MLLGAKNYVLNGQYFFCYVLNLVTLGLRRSHIKIVM